MAGYIHHYDSHLKSVAVLVPTAAEINFHNFFFFWLKQNKCIILQLRKSKVQNISYGTKTKASIGLLSFWRY